jgi:multicomponent Na+:H+ antiporter subunit F
MFNTLLILALTLLSISILASLYRVFKGPSMPDRVIAMDSIGINIIGVVAILSVILNTLAFLEIILLIGILAFIGTIAFSKFLERGVVIEHRRDQ